jgi:hypothetical protein
MLCGGTSGGTSAVFIEEQNPASKAKFIVHRVLSYSWIYVRNLGNLVVPVQLCPDWTGGAIPNVTSFGYISPHLSKSESTLTAH